MKSEEQQILLRCRELTSLLEASEPPAWQAWDHRDWEVEYEHGPRYLAGKWFGPQDERMRMRYRRAVDSLERAGLVTTHREWGGKLTHLALTAAGVDAAELLAAEGVTDG
ncbi:hypothetical protein [Lacipirellula limnantheis]|uniref:MarR family transcriptional regulator n=1 Tax=Lacipirellula limnantheis TaxID=2528024 RepID=A0A517U1F3_9BACT|nr:hypothetical protein [Lacipirellula limnantheis]QDT74433.1 hypothetical protein I41_36290 [Lacipirellula limnantheis]